MSGTMWVAPNAGATWSELAKACPSSKIAIGMVSWGLGDSRTQLALTGNPLTPYDEYRIEFATSTPNPTKGNKMMPTKPKAPPTSFIMCANGDCPRLAVGSAEVPAQGEGDQKRLQIPACRPCGGQFNFDVMTNNTQALEEEVRTLRGMVSSVIARVPMKKVNPKK